MKRKIILVILISIIFILLQVVVDILFYDVNKTTVADAAAVTTVDLTGLMEGTAASHTHIYERKYDANQHWEACWICGNLRNVKNHNLVKTGYSFGVQSCAPGNNYTIYCADGCGYSILTKDSCISNEIYECVPARYLHTGHCINCGSWAGGGGCIDENGQNITCMHLGTCAVCKYTYTDPIHHIAWGGVCQFCGQQFIELVSQNVSYSSDYKTAVMEWRLRGVNGGKLTGTTNWYHPTPVEGRDSESIKNADNDYTYRLKIRFKDNVQDAVQPSFDTYEMLTIDGKVVHVGGFQLTAYYDHVPPTPNSIGIVGNGNTNAYSTKAVITASVRETYSNTVQMRLLDSDGRTVISNWGAATENADIFTRSFDVVAEIREPSTLFVESRDYLGNVCRQSIRVQYIDAKAPVLTNISGNGTNWTKNREITYTVTDNGIGNVKIGFNKQSDLQLATKNGDSYTRTYNFVGDLYGTATGALYLQDELGNIRTERVTISNIDNTKPTITNLQTNLSSDKKSISINVLSNDFNRTLNKEGSGVIGYAITSENEEPSINKFQTANPIVVNKNGRYYVWIIDRAGNISESVEILVKDLNISILGEITNQDENNIYNSRKERQLKVYRKVGSGVEQLVGTIDLGVSQESYIYDTQECNDLGEYYTYRIEETHMPGYEIIYDNNNITCSNTQNQTINITNRLILPKYTSVVTYEKQHMYQDRFLKNGKIKIKAILQNIDEKIYEKLGLSNGLVTFELDTGISIEDGTIEIKYTNGDGIVEDVTNYEINNNVITTSFNGRPKEKIEINAVGRINEIKNYNSVIRLNGNLISYIGEITDIDLQTLTQAEQAFLVEYQTPQAKITLKKEDSITNRNLTDAEFTLFEWNGNEYVEKEILKDTNQDGYYESSYYEWNYITDGRYKIKETKLPKSYKDGGAHMEFTINELRGENYTIIPTYNNEEYKLNYKQEPDGLDKVNGIIENEPYKLKIKIHNIDSETKKEINSNAIYKIYEWNKVTGQYEEYNNYLNGGNVGFNRETDKTYLVNEWVYYTDKNEGKYRVVEELAAYGYYGDYETTTNNKRTYDINILDIVENGQYGGQEIENEGVIEIYNNADKRVTSNRVKGEINVQVVDAESKKNEAQGNGTLEGAVYGLYAREQINHADGITSRYEGEQGVLYKVNEQVMLAQTDASGRFKLDDLEGGKYYLKQVNENEGYNVDQNVYEFDLTYQGQEVEKIVKNQIILLSVKKQGIQMIKIKTDYENNASPLQGSGFKIYLTSNLSIVRQDKITKNPDGTYTLNDEEAKKDSSLNKKANKNGTYNLSDLIDYYYKIVYKSEEEMKMLPRGEKQYYPYNLEMEQEATYYNDIGVNQVVGELYSNEDGYLRSPELPYGEYIMIETTVPDNYEAANPFEIKVEHDGRDLQKIKYVYDPNFETRIKLHLIDSDTKKDILKQGTKFVIENKETGDLETYKHGRKEYGTYDNPYEITSEDGIYITNQRLRVGKYIIKELESPDGYVLRGKEAHSEDGKLVLDSLPDVEFEVGTNQMYYVDDFYEDNISVTIEENTEQVSTISVNVKGEALESANTVETVVENLENQGKNIQYKIIQLSGVKMGLYAEEDIYTQDNQGTIRYKKDELVRQAVTNENGIVHFENVEIGKYYIKEIDTINGYTRNSAIIKVENKYDINRSSENKSKKAKSDKWKQEAQETPVIWKSANTLKDRQKVHVRLESYSVDGKTIFGTTYGIYASRDIYNYKGELVVKKDELMKKAITSKDGKAVFMIDLPLDEYYVKEIKPREGYITNKTTNDVNALYNLEEGRVLERKVKFVSDYTKTRIHVLDKKTNEEVENVILNITDINGNVVIPKMASKNGGILVIRLPVGEYYLQEESVPYEFGYVRTNRIRFEVKDTKDEGLVEIKQDHTKITFNIEDQNGKEVKDGEFVIKNENGQEIGQFIPNVGIGLEDKSEKQILTRLPIGKYTIQSNKLDEKYARVNKEFEIVDTEGIQVFTIKAEEAIFDLGIQKWNSKIILIEDGVQKVRLTGIEPSMEENKIMRVDLNKKRIEKTIIKFIYTIKVTNIGEVSGYVNEIQDKIPEGLELAEGENKDWKEENGIAKTNILSEKLLKPGESASVEIVLKWKNSGDNTGVKENIAEITKSSNKYGIKEKDEEQRGNFAKSIVLLGIVTGKEEKAVYGTIIVMVVSIISLGIILIKRYVI